MNILIYIFYYNTFYFIIIFIIIFNFKNLFILDIKIIFKFKFILSKTIFILCLKNKKYNKKNQNLLY